MSSINTIIADEVALTTTATASTKTVKCKSENQHAIYVKWTPGTAANVFAFTVETTAVPSPAATDWTADMQLADTSGAKTRQAITFSHAAANTTAIWFRFDLDGLLAEELRVTYSESEAGSATKGTATVRVLSNHS